MMFKVLVLLALGALVSASPVPQHQLSGYQPQAELHVAQPHHKLEHHEPEPYDAHPKYNYSYDVHDHLTYDAKSQTESRDGDVVQGEYSVHDPDGFLRIVKYTVDPQSGFQAVVNRTPLDHKGHAPSAPSHLDHSQHNQQ